MRKVSSAPSLATLQGLVQHQPPGQHSSNPAPAPLGGSRLKRETRVGEGGGTQRLGSYPKSSDGGRRQGRSHSTRLKAHDAAAPPPSLLDTADQLVLETFQPNGIFGSGGCLEMYGKVASAPDLRSAVADSASGDQGPEPHSPSVGAGLIQGRPELGGDERLAECLATPFTGDDKNLGEIVGDEAKEAMKQARLRTQLRYAEETRLQEELGEREGSRPAALTSDVEEPTRAETPHQARQRRKRRASEDVYAYLQKLGLSAEPDSTPPANVRSSSPDTQAALDSIFASWDDDSNRLHVDSQEAPLSQEQYARMLRAAPSTRVQGPLARAMHAESPTRQSLRA